MSNERRKALQAKFQLAARERLTKLNLGLQELVNQPEKPERTQALLRELHTLKGDAKMVGLPAVNRAAHRLEDVLLWCRDQHFALSPEQADLLYSGLDLVTLLVEEGEAAAGSEEQWLAFSAGADRLVGPQRQAAPPPPPAEPAAATHAPGPQPAAAPAPQAAQAEESHAADGYVRVPRRRLAELTHLAAELNLRQGLQDKLLAELGRLHRGLRVATEGGQEARAGGGLEAAARRPGVALALGREMGGVLGRMRNEAFETQLQLRDLSDRVREMRLRPIGELLEPVPRLARDIARELGKRVQVELGGLETRIDEQVLEALEDPLLHLVRNAIDHGIEDGELRRSRGKSATGTLTVSARQLRNRVELTLEDDGNGLDLGRIREAGVRAGALSAEQAALLDDGAAAALIFLPGLSTRQEASENSGRGIGLDVVKERVEQLGGTVQVSGQPGRGTRFTLRVPVSVALAPALLFQASDGIYALPSGAVVEVLRMPSAEVRPAALGRAIPYGETLVPLYDFEELVGAPGLPPSAELVAAVVRREGTTFALRVMRLLGERALVQRPLDPFLQGLQLFTGSAVIDGGRVALVANVAELVRRAERHRSDWAGGEAPTPSRRQRRVLVVDDSEVVRDLMVGLAGKLGWVATEAVDGADALEKVAALPPDLVITDLDMPVLDGVGFLRKYRAAHGRAPVIVLSARGSREDKQLAMDAGANAYLVKSSFSEAEFARTLEVLVGDA